MPVLETPVKLASIDQTMYKTVVIHVPSYIKYEESFVFLQFLVANN